MRGSTIHNAAEILSYIDSNPVTVYGLLGLSITEQGDVNINLKAGASGSMTQVTNSEGKKAVLTFSGGQWWFTRDSMHELMENNPYIMNQIWSVPRLREIIQSKYGKDERYTSYNLLSPNAEILADFMFEFPNHFGRFTVMTQEMANDMLEKCDQELKKIQSRK